MNTLNKTFKAGDVLLAVELNSIVSKINDIISNLPSGTGGDNPSSGVTDLDITNKVNAAKNELMALIEELLSQVGDIVELVNGLEDGSFKIDSEEQFLRAIKLQCNTVLLDLNLAKTEDGQIVPSINLATLVQDVETLLTQYAGLSALPGKVALIANNFDLQGNPIYNGAQIIAAINEDGDSTVGINADKVIIGGDVTLTDKLTTMTADIGTLNAATANIKNAIIEAIEAGDVTITGTLNYNRLVGNVVTVNPDEDRAIPLDATYVKIGDFTGAYADIWLLCPTASGSITIPVGHTVFIESKQNVSVCVNDASNLYGTHLLAGWVYDHIEDVPVGEGDSERYYVYHWGLVEYNGNDIKTYNNSPNGYNLQGAAVHSYMWTGTRWVETTNLSNIKTMERSQLS